MATTAKEMSDLVPLAEGAMLSSIAYHKLVRLVQIKEVKGVRQSGRWYCSKSDVLRYARENAPQSAATA